MVATIFTLPTQLPPLLKSVGIGVGVGKFATIKDVVSVVVVVGVRVEVGKLVAVTDVVSLSDVTVVVVVVGVGKSVLIR